MIFCNDVDLLYWEPYIFRDAAFASQELLSGSGDLNGNVFVISAGSLTTAHVVANQVVALSGAVSGCYPITSINSATQMIVSVLYDGLYPASGAGTPTPVGTAAGLSFAVRTFWPQRRIVSELLLRSAGIDDETALSATSKITNPEKLRRPAVLGTLQMIYNALSAAAGAPTEYRVRSELYERLYARALRQARVEIDRNGDGVGDLVRPLNVLQLARA